MRVPVPTNKTVAFTLLGALLTAVVAGFLAMPIGGISDALSSDDASPSADSNVSAELGETAPTPNEAFSPSVQTQSRYEEHDEYEEDEEEYEEDEEEYEEDEEEYEEEYEEAEEEYDED